MDNDCTTQYSYFILYTVYNYILIYLKTVNTLILIAKRSYLNRPLKIRQKQADFIYTLKAFLILLPISIHLETDSKQKYVDLRIQRDFNDLLWLKSGIIIWTRCDL